jgi:ATP-dependent Clp protease ATP-binding subunit ClpA
MVSIRAEPLPIDDVARSIMLLRGQKVILDAELAALYGVTTKRLNEQVKRNRERFPSDFVFQLTRAETEALNRSQIATGSQKHRDPRFPPFAFTQHGAIMVASVVNSATAAEMSVYVVRAFVKLREFLATHQELAHKLDELEERLSKKLASHDEAIAAILSAIREFTSPPAVKRRPIGFTADLTACT